MKINKEYAMLQFEIAKTYAQYWQTAALTNMKRNIWHDDRLLTQEEVNRDSLETALRHIHRMNELAELLGSDE